MTNPLDETLRPELLDDAIARRMLEEAVVDAPMLTLPLIDRFPGNVVVAAELPIVIPVAVEVPIEIVEELSITTSPPPRDSRPAEGKRRECDRWACHRHGDAGGNEECDQIMHCSLWLRLVVMASTASS